MKTNYLEQVKTLNDDITCNLHEQVFRPGTCFDVYVKPYNVKNPKHIGEKFPSPAIIKVKMFDNPVEEDRFCATTHSGIPYGDWHIKYLTEDLADKETGDEKTDFYLYKDFDDLDLLTKADVADAIWEQVDEEDEDDK